MYQSKISRTKKRLSDDRWSMPAILFSLFGLLAILTFGLRAVTLAAAYGVVPLEIPVVQAAINDPGLHGYREEPRISLTQSTPAVVLTADAFYFGDLTAFTTNLSGIRDKYIIRHIDGAPQLQPLLEQLTAWVRDRAQHQNVPPTKVLVLIPAGDIPLPIVTQVVAGLRTSPNFERVILSNGLM